MPRHIQCRLNAHALAHLKAFLPLPAHFTHDAGHLMPDHDRVFRHVIRNALVPRTERHALVVADADRVGHDLDNDTILAHNRKFNILQSQVARSVKTPGFRSHAISPL